MIDKYKAKLMKVVNNTKNDMILLLNIQITIIKKTYNNL